MSSSSSEQQQQQQQQRRLLATEFSSTINYSPRDDVQQRSSFRGLRLEPFGKAPGI
jgi:hypothetical protein